MTNRYPPVLGHPPGALIRRRREPRAVTYSTFRTLRLLSHHSSHECASDDVGLSTLSKTRVAATTLVSYIVHRCHDGNPTPCAAGPGG